MKELYLAIAILCFLVAIMIYCVNKTIQALRELYIIWRDYKQIQEDVLNFPRKNK